VAEEKAAAPAPEAASAPPPSGNKSSIVLVALAVVNMAIVAAVGFMLFKGKQKEAQEPKIEQVIKGEHEAQAHDHEKQNSFIGKVVPLETFIVNLAESKGRKVAKVNIELELQGNDIADEIDKRKAQVRDIIIILLSSKTYDEVSTREGKEALRNEIKEQLNSFLTTGEISAIYFTEFIYN
jgi:flagellar FliL protein